MFISAVAAPVDRKGADLIDRIDLLDMSSPTELAEMNGSVTRCTTWTAQEFGSALTCPCATIILFPMHPRPSERVLVSGADFQRDFDRFQRLAQTQAIEVMNDGRPHTVLISAEEHLRLKRRDRQVLSLDDFFDADIAAIEAAEPPTEASQFDHEVK